MVIPLTHHKKTAINYPFVYRIFNRCAKGIVIKVIYIHGGVYYFKDRNALALDFYSNPP